ncbi:MAG: TonB-dependent receptor [Opitutaceae bacterium]|nr:TonB-dependent receptor [Opitutaceae bacterium]
MKPHTLLFRTAVASLTFLLTEPIGQAADAAGRPAAQSVGSIAGRVQNVATGQYLNNARVGAKGTDLTAFTDQTGSYRLSAVPSGPVILEVFFTGLDAQQIPVTVRAGETLSQDVNLTSETRYGTDASGTVKLDSFVVATSRETDGDAIAINEQRFSPNIKNVVAADAMGDVMDGNVGEFLKFMPGITAEYDRDSGGSVSSVSVRGFPTNMAVVSGDGLQMASTGNTVGTSRVFQFTQVSINNISRLEVTKVPTPANPADSMAGSIDMVSKSSFERKNAQFRYTFGVSGNPKTMSLRRVPHINDEREYKTLPSFTFDYTLPVTKTFGIVLTGQSQNRFIEMQWVPRTFNATAAGTGASFARPYLQTFQLIGVPRRNERNAAGIKADWRVTTNGVLSFSFERTRWVSERANVAITFNAGTNAVPLPATGGPLTFGDDFTSGATGRGSVNLANAGAGVHLPLDTRAASVRYRHDDGNWRIVAAAGGSTSAGGYNDIRYGRFRTLDIVNRVPVRVSFANIDDVRPQSIQVFDNNGREFDFNNLDNYQLNGATSQQRMVKDRLTNAKLDVRKSLPALSVPAAIQVGGLHRLQVRDARRESISWTYNGPDGNPATPDAPTPYRMVNYVNQEEKFGFRDMPWVSTFKAWRAYESNPALFGQTPAQQAAQEQYRLNNSEWLREAVSAGYAQAEIGLFRNRLKVLAGVRYEKTEANGQGVLNDPNAVFLRNPDGSFAHTATGQRIRRPEAGAAGSLEELALTRRERGFKAANSYDGYYPSVHATYQIRDGLLARAAYAKTYGRPDFINIVPNTTVNETDFDDNIPDPDGVPGRITSRNTGLRPWTGDNYDLSLEYYTEHGGLLSAGVFLKDIQGFFGTDVRLATAADLELLGMDPRYIGWQISTRFNQPGTARVSGVEFNVRHPLRPLGAWGRHLQVFANATKLRLEGSRDSDFSGFIPKSANWGIDFSRKPFNVMLKWNYRGLQRLSRVAALGPDAFEYAKSRTRLDVNVDYQLRPNLFLYTTVQNIFDVPETLLRYGSATPGYAHVFQVLTTGVQLSLGVKGTF